MSALLLLDEPFEYQIAFNNGVIDYSYVGIYMLESLNLTTNFQIETVNCYL